MIHIHLNYLNYCFLFFFNENIRFWVSEESSVPYLRQWGHLGEVAGVSCNIFLDSKCLQMISLLYSPVKVGINDWSVPSSVLLLGSNVISRDMNKILILHLAGAGQLRDVSWMRMIMNRLTVVWITNWNLTVFSRKLINSIHLSNSNRNFLQIIDFIVQELKF